MKRFRPKAWQSVLVLAALSPVFLDRCVSIGVSGSKTVAAETATGSLDVIVVEKSDDARATQSEAPNELDPAGIVVGLEFAVATVARKEP